MHIIGYCSRGRVNGGGTGGAPVADTRVCRIHESKFMNLTYYYYARSDRGFTTSITGATIGFALTTWFILCDEFKAIKIEGPSKYFQACRHSQ